MQLKEIDMDDITINPEQPREHFDTDKIKELGESIKEVGLINPINVEKKGKRYEIVSGERRYRGNKVIKNKKILAIIKEYKKAGDKAVESLIENVHREDLKIKEKGKYLLKIKETEKIPNNNLLAKRVSLSLTDVNDCLDSIEVAKEVKGPLTYSQVHETKSLEPKDRIRLIKKSQKEELGGRKLRKLATTIKKAPKQVKEAMFKDEITVDEAEDIKDFDEEKQKVAIKGIKLMKRTIKEMPKAIKDVETEKKTALDVIKKLQSELGSTTGKMYKMSHILDGFYDEKVFDVIPKDYKKTILQIVKELEKAGAELTKSIIKIRGHLK